VRVPALRVGNPIPTFPLNNDQQEVIMTTASDLLIATDRLTRAAEHRENTMGDPMRLIEVQAELREATKQARNAIAETKLAT